MKKFKKKAALIIIALVMLVGCEKTKEEIRVLYDFENEAQLDEISWSCRVLYARDHQHAVSGECSLRLEIHPDSYPGFKSGKMEENWSGYRFLKLDIFYPGTAPLNLAYRIDDRWDNPPYGDRLNGSLSLRPGKNSISLDLASLKTSGSKRLLRLAHIDKLYLFLCSPKQPVVLYLDYIRLENTR